MRKEFSILLAVCSFCDCLIVFVFLSLLVLGLDVDLIVSIPEFLYLLCSKGVKFSQYTYCDGTFINSTSLEKNNISNKNVLRIQFTNRKFIDQTHVLK